jgi:tetratricopeptide (TPR) repeat protein
MSSEVAIGRSAAMPGSQLLARLPARTEEALRRMFADPYLLEGRERGELVAGLRQCVAASPEVPELRVLLGMALCVNFEVADAIEELREGIRLAPDSYIAHLKMGELWMRLRVCDKAEEHTRQASLLAQGALQSELARLQARKLRELQRQGIRRGGAASRGGWGLLGSIRRLWGRGRAPSWRQVRVEAPSPSPSEV